jgi:hypothetical protein
MGDAMKSKIRRSQSRLYKVEGAWEMFVFAEKIMLIEHNVYKA